LCGVTLRGQPIRFRTSDGVQLVGAVLGRGKSGVVFVNGWTAPPAGSLSMVRESYQRGIPPSGIYCTWLRHPRLAKSLLGDGIQLLLFDYRGTGSSGPGHGPAADRFDRDVAAAVNEIERRGAYRYTLVGGSLGGVIAIATAPELNPKPSAIVGLSASGFAGTNSGRNYGNLDAKAAVERLPVPLLLIAANHDREAPAADSRVLARAAITDTKRLLIVPGSSHMTALLGNDPSADKVRTLIVDFIEQHANR
jgi:alpha-beta hydrolase superfamily lysophospholipase